MKLTTRTNLALRTLMVCAANPTRLLRKAEVARTINASENHLAQVIHLLARRGYLHTRRGRAGGLQLAVAPAKIRVGDVLRNFEASLPFTECANATDNTCPLIEACRLKAAFRTALTAFYDALDKVTLADLVTDNPPLHRLLGVT